MIFLSHTYKDKPVVREIAQRLEAIYGRDKIFYDEWSIQPGESIIGRMNTGIEQCQFFFFFISENSLMSKMVQLEWQSALMKKNREGIKFIPIRLDNSLLPAIISQTLYIDLYSNGLENTLRQLVDVIQGNNTFRPTQKLSNLIARVKKELDSVSIEISAEYFMEPHSSYAIVIDNDENELTWELPDFFMVSSSFYKDVSFTLYGKVNCIIISVTSATSPGFPVKIILKPRQENVAINVLNVFHEVKRKCFQEILTIFN